MKNLWANYCRNTQGNFAIMFSVVVGVLVLAIAVVIETSRMHQAKGVLQDMADTAAISGAQVARIDPDGREQAVRDSISFHQEFIPDYNLAENTTVRFDDDAEEVEVSVEIPRSFNSFLVVC